MSPTARALKRSRSIGLTGAQCVLRALPTQRISGSNAADANHPGRHEPRHRIRGPKSGRTSRTGSLRRRPGGLASAPARTLIGSRPHRSLPASLGWPLLLARDPWGAGIRHGVRSFIEWAGEFRGCGAFCCPSRGRVMQSAAAPWRACGAVQDASRDHRTGGEFNKGSGLL